MTTRAQTAILITTGISVRSPGSSTARPAVVVFNGTSYRYLYNLQGDVTGLLDGSNAQVVTYRYDAWGRQLSCTGTLAATLGKLQPFRYRCYAYDEETKLYYVNSRYYDPEVCRWICADKIAYLGVNDEFLSFNLFVYCSNNPVKHVDLTGNQTTGIGANINFNALIGASLSIGKYFDKKGNTEWQGTYAGPGSEGTFSEGLLDVGAALFIQITDRESVQDLHGLSTSSGFSVGDLVYLSVDFMAFDNDDDDDDSLRHFGGVQLSLGIGYGVDLHTVVSNTEEIEWWEQFR